jgi:hypothetical protein
MPENNQLRYMGLGSTCWHGTPADSSDEEAGPSGEDARRKERARRKNRSPSFLAAAHLYLPETLFGTIRLLLMTKQLLEQLKGLVRGNATQTKAVKDALKRTVDRVDVAFVRDPR